MSPFKTVNITGFFDYSLYFYNVSYYTIAVKSDPICDTVFRNIICSVNIYSSAVFKIIRFSAILRNFIKTA